MNVPPELVAGTPIKLAMMDRISACRVCPGIAPVALVLCLLCLYADGVRAAAASFAVQSGKEKIAVLELYTSEGCSSCPPADRFVSTLAAAGYYPGRVIPLAFHVTYWDYIGWRDPYASAAFDARQYAVAARQQRQGVYTPQLVLDGRNLRGTGNFNERLRALNTQMPAAHISVTGNAGEAAVQLDIAVRVTDPVQRRAAALYVALVESDLSSTVTAGENRGSTLQHDHVVRQLIGPLRLPSDRDDSHHTATIAMPAVVGRGHASLAVFVQNQDDGSVLQALATPLTGTGAVP